MEAGQGDLQTFVEAAEKGLVQRFIGVRRGDDDAVGVVILHQLEQHVDHPRNFADVVSLATGLGDGVAFVQEEGARVRVGGLKNSLQVGRCLPKIGGDEGVEPALCAGAAPSPRRAAQLLGSCHIREGRKQYLLWSGKPMLARRVLAAYPSLSVGTDFDRFRQHHEMAQPLPLDDLN